MHITLQTVEFTSIGLLKLLSGEHNDIVLEDAALIVPDCTLGAPNTDITGERGRLQVTSKRIIWLGKTKSSSDRKRSCCFALKCVERVKMSTGMPFPEGCLALPTATNLYCKQDVEIVIILIHK